MVKKLYKNQEDKVFCGIIGGLGEYFKIDSTILRVGYVLVTVFTGIVLGLVAYFAICLVVPKAPK